MSTRTVAQLRAQGYHEGYQAAMADIAAKAAEAGYAGVLAWVVDNTVTNDASLALVRLLYSQELAAARRFGCIDT